MSDNDNQSELDWAADPRTDGETDRGPDTASTDHVDRSTVQRAVAVLMADYERQDCHLSMRDVIRTSDKRALTPSQAASVLAALEEKGISLHDHDDSEDDLPDGEFSGEAEDPVHALLRHSKAFPLLDREQELDLARRIRLGMEAEKALGGGSDRVGLAGLVQQGEAARQRFVESNLRLVVWVAQDLITPDGMEYSDLVQHGFLGLIRAIEKFDPANGARFGTYAVWWIRQACVRGIHDQGRVIRLPSYIHGRLFRLRRARKKLRRELDGRNPSDRELTEELECDLGQLAFLKDLESMTVVREWVDDEGKTVQILDVLPQNTFERPDNASEREERSQKVMSILTGFTEREQYIITRRFGLDGGAEMTLEEIGRELGVSRERVRQIESEVLARLSKKAELRNLQDD